MNRVNDQIMQNKIFIKYTMPKTSCKPIRKFSESVMNEVYPTLQTIQRVLYMQIACEIYNNLDI